MSRFRWWSRILGSLRRDELDREMEREMAFHLEMSAQRNVRRGMPGDAAARQARVAFGSVDAIREEAYDTRRARLLENVLADIRFSFRSLRRAPSFAAATIVTMALGIAASTAIFSVVDAVLLRPLPIPDPEDFVYVGWVWNKGGDIPALTSLQYQFVREQNRLFSAFAAYDQQESALGTPAKAAASVRGLRVGGDFFRTIGFTPRLGRAFAPAELENGDPSVVILGDATWRGQFASDSGIVGRRILLDDKPVTVIGVMPPDFRFPPAVKNDGFLVPFAVRVNPTDEGHNTGAIARLRHGTSDAERAAALAALSQRFAAAYPTLAAPHESFRLYDDRDVNVGPIRTTLWVLFGAVSLLLVIACANTATLLLVRASSRQREFAVRASIGAGRGRILQQLLTEGLVLAALSTAAGVALGVAAQRAFLAVAPSVLPAGMNPQLDGRVLAYAIALSALTGIVFGFASAVPSVGLRLQSHLVSATRGATSGGTRLREGLILLETAAAVVLLAGATILTASFARLMSVDPGFDPDHVVAVRLGKLPGDYDAARREQLVTRLLDRLRALPGVERVASAPSLPLERGRNFPVDTKENPELAIGAVELRFVSSDYFATLGIPLTGRDFSNDDVSGSEPVAIVNEAFARHFWKSGSPVGREIQIGHYNDHWLRPNMAHQTRVIGVARDVREIGLDRPARPTVLVPRAQSDGNSSVLLARIATPAIANRLATLVLAEEPRLSPTVEPLTAVVSRSVAGPRFRSLLIGSFAGAALLLATVGIYGVIAAIVEQRRREISIRISLGATSANVTVAVVRRCLIAVTAGAGVGLVAFWGVRRTLSAMVFDTSPGDPRLLALAVAVLALAAMVAAWVPARRATRVDPAISLRLE